MFHSRSVLVILIIGLATGLACGLPTTIILQDTNLISTAAAQTVMADLTLVALSATSAVTPSPPTETSTPEPPTSSPTSTSTATFTVTTSPTSTFTPTLTPTLTRTATPSIPVISVYVPTNCRSGPGKIYDWVGSLLVGETAQVFGRDPSGTYWYIRNPDSPYSFCWVWGEYATLVGNTAFLPILTPPPTPTPTITSTPSPAFELSYSDTDNCNKGWWSEFKIKNTGSIPFKSQAMTVKDTASGIVLANYADGFTNNDGCLASTKWDTLSTGKTYTVSAPAFNYDPSGHRIHATITLCSSPGQSGTCLTKAINFTP